MQGVFLAVGVTLIVPVSALSALALPPSAVKRLAGSVLTVPADIFRGDEAISELQAASEGGPLALGTAYLTSSRVGEALEAAADSDGGEGLADLLAPGDAEAAHEEALLSELEAPADTGSGDGNGNDGEQGNGNGNGDHGQGNGHGSGEGPGQGQGNDNDNGQGNGNGNDGEQGNGNGDHGQGDGNGSEEGPGQGQGNDNDNGQGNGNGEGNDGNDGEQGNGNGDHGQGDGNGSEEGAPARVRGMTTTTARTTETARAWTRHSLLPSLSRIRTIKRVEARTRAGLLRTRAGRDRAAADRTVTVRARARTRARRARPRSWR